MPITHISSLVWKPLIPAILALPYSEHLGATYGAHPLSCRPAVLHSYALGVPHFPFGPAFDTIGLHWVYLLFCEQ